MLTITKYGKSLCYRKDGNRLGRRKEQDILTKALERSMLKQAINSYAGTVYGGPLDASKCASIGVGSDTVYRGMFGNNNHIHSSIGSMGTGIITIDGIPYNSMDEFDRPVSDKDKAQYLDFQFNARKAYKAEYRLEEGTNTYKPLEGVMLKPNKVEDSIWEAKKWEADNKLIMPSSAWDRLDKKLSGGFKRDELCFIGSYMSPEEFTINPSLTMVSELIANDNKNVTMVGLENQHDKPIIMHFIENENKPLMAWLETTKDRILETNTVVPFTIKNITYSSFNIDNLVNIIDEILVKDGCEVYVISSEDSSENFLDDEIGYKVIIIKKDNFDVEDNIALEFTTYVTMQEGLLHLLDEIKGDINLQIVLYQTEKGITEAIVRRLTEVKDIE